MAIPATEPIINILPRYPAQKAKSSFRSVINFRSKARITIAVVRLSKAADRKNGSKHNNRTNVIRLFWKFNR